MADDWGSLTKRVKEANDIVDVVGTYVALRPAGKKFKGLCPFHDDHRPSFDVDPQFQNYRCWSSGKNGDVFVADGYVNSRVVQFDKNGKFIRIIGGVKGAGPGQMQLVHGVVIDSQDRIIASDSDNKRLSVFDKNGNFITTWAAPCRGGIAITPDDTIYVSDVNAGAVTILKEGRILDVVHVEGRPHGLGIDPTTLDIYTSSSVATSPNVSKAVRKTPKAAAAN